MCCLLIIFKLIILLNHENQTTDVVKTNIVNILSWISLAKLTMNILKYPFPDFPDCGPTQQGSGSCSFHGLVHFSITFACVGHMA